MMRRFLVMVAVLLVGAAAPAIAKGVDGVTLTGGDQTVTIEWEHVYGEDGDLASLVHATHLYDVDYIDGESDPRPTGDLGPAVVAEWNFPNPIDTVIVQHLYPLAENGPVAHIPAGQAYLDWTTADLWHPLRPEIVEMLDAAGLDLAALEESASAWGPIPVEAAGSMLVLGALLLLVAIMRGWRIRQVA